MRERIAVALSGGVDSAVAAALLIERGYDVFGVTMLLGDFTDDVEAKQVARTLGILHFSIDLRMTFKSKIIDYFLKEYLCGRTPNPCIVCNRLIKFGELLEFALKKGATHLATGHYVRVEYDGPRGRFLVFKAADAAKDQSYMFWSLSQEQLSRLKMPLGLLKKVDIRSMAEERDLPVKKLESQETCFISKGDYRSFLLAKVREEILPGEIVDEKGEVLGKHKGLPFYTIGQRKGLGLAHPTPLYVLGLRPEENVVVVGEERSLYKTELIASGVNLIPFDSLKGRKTRVRAKVRYKVKEAEAILIPLEIDRVKIEFSIPQRAIAPGQSVVFYQNDMLLGGGVIESAK